MLSTHKISQSNELDDQAKKQVIDLWNQEYPEKLTYNNPAEFDDYLQKLSNKVHFLLTNTQNVILGWAITFDRENERWFAIILSEEIKGQGFGRQMIDKLKESETILNASIIDHNNNKKRNGQTYLSPLKFYEKCGFTVLSNERIESDKISAVKVRWTKKSL